MTAQVAAMVEYTGAPAQIQQRRRLPCGLASSWGAWGGQAGDAARWALRAPLSRHTAWGLVARPPEGLGLQLGLDGPLLLGLAAGHLLELADPQLVEPAHAHVRVAEVAPQPAVAPRLGHDGDGLGGVSK